MEYYKINSIYKREQSKYTEEMRKLHSEEFNRIRQNFIIGDYACPEFANIKNWRVTEKIDGTNIRIEYKKWMHDDGYEVEDFTVKGRTENAQIPPHLLRHLQATFTVEKIKAVFPDCNNVVLFGEGYGPKIQSCGSLYASEAGFVLFDVVIGPWILKFDDVKELAGKLGIPHVPDLGVMTTQEVDDYVRSSPTSLFSKNKQIMEGVVCTPEPVMLFRDGRPIKMKVKCKDFHT